MKWVNMPNVLKQCGLRFIRSPEFSLKSLAIKKLCDAMCVLPPFVQFKKRENTQEGVLLLVKLQAKVYNFTKSNNAPLVYFRLFKLHKWYQIA